MLSLTLLPFEFSSQLTKPVCFSTCYILASKLRSPFPVSPTCRNTKVHWSFQPTFWEHPHRVYRKSSYPTFPSLPCQHFCCPPVTSLLSFSTEYPRQVTFHLRHWVHLLPRCQVSKPFPLSSGRMPPAPDLVDCARLLQHGPSSLFSPHLTSTVHKGIWRPSSPK